MKNQSGFTLLEILVAIVILGVSLIALFDLFSGSLRLAAASGDTLKAAILGQKKMDDLRLKGFIINADETEGRFEGEPDYSWSVAVAPYKTLFKRDQEMEEMKEVDLTIHWNEGARQKEFRLVRLYNPMAWGYSDTTYAAMAGTGPVGAGARLGGIANGGGGSEAVPAGAQHISGSRGQTAKVGDGGKEGQTFHVSGLSTQTGSRKVEGGNQKIEQHICGR